MFSILQKDGAPRIADLGETSLPEFLGELGFSAYRELGYNKLLLVEGVSEIRAIRELLFKYRNGNLNCVLMHLGGDNLVNAKARVEMSEYRICENVAVLVDSERALPGGTPKKGRDEFGQICTALGFEFHMLERRALENYFPDYACKEGCRPGSQRVRAL